MSAHTKEELEDMLFEIVDLLDLNDKSIEHHGPRGTSPVELVREVLELKDRQIRLLRRGYKGITEVKSIGVRAQL